jgi:hypothetical protein
MRNLKSFTTSGAVHIKGEDYIRELQENTESTKR